MELNRDTELTLKQAADLCRTSERTLQRQINDKILAARM